MRMHPYSLGNRLLLYSISHSAAGVCSLQLNICQDMTCVLNTLNYSAPLEGSCEKKETHSFFNFVWFQEAWLSYWVRLHLSCLLYFQHYCWIAVDLSDLFAKYMTESQNFNANSYQESSTTKTYTNDHWGESCEKGRYKSASFNCSLHLFQHLVYSCASCEYVGLCICTWIYCTSHAVAAFSVWIVCVLRFYLAWSLFLTRLWLAFWFLFKKPTGYCSVV